MEFNAFEPGIEINGQIVYSTVAAFPMARCVPARILFNKGIGKRVNKKFQIDDNEWYQQQVWLDVLKEMSSRFGDDALSRIGTRIAGIVPLPEWAKEIDSAIKFVNIAYHISHKKDGKIMFDPDSGVMLDGIGHISCSRNGEEYIIVSESPYPCAFEKGIITAIVQQFKPNVSVIHDDSTPCRKNGNESCTYKVRL